jgi:hypothetical protein
VTGARKLAIAALVSALSLSALGAATACADSPRGIWVSPEALASLPTSGPAWRSLIEAADRGAGTPDLSNKAGRVNVQVMAKALAFIRTGDERYRREVIEACRAVIGSEKGGSTLSLGRKLVAYVIAADLVGLPTADAAAFRDWLRQVRNQKLKGKTLISTHEKRPNNWGTHAGASRIAIAVYLDDRQDLERAAKVFKGWLGDREAYDGFKYGDLSWQADPRSPVGINPEGAVKRGHVVDGVLPDDQRRGGPFAWPPPRENYVYGALQGALVQAVILHRAGYDVWSWEREALLRAFRWLHQQADFPARGDDTWTPHLVNYYYGSHFPAPVPSQSGKNVGWTDWSHGARTPRDAAAPPGTRPEAHPDRSEPSPDRLTGLSRPEGVSSRLTFVNSEIQP